MTRSVLVERFFGSLAAHDLEGYAACLHEDVVVELPFSKGAGPLDREGLLRLDSFLLKNFTEIRFEIIRVHELVATDALIVEYGSHFESETSGITYDNRYIGLFEFRDGLVSRRNVCCRQPCCRRARPGANVTVTRRL
jgi:ketosteroid isomerase-like protein